MDSGVRVELEGDGCGRVTFHRPEPDPDTDDRTRYAGWTPPGKVTETPYGWTVDFGEDLLDIRFSTEMFGDTDWVVVLSQIGRVRLRSGRTKLALDEPAYRPVQDALNAAIDELLEG